MNDINDDLLVKYLLGEASEEERTAVTTWLDANAANRKYYADMQLIWEQSRQLASNSTVDENAAWQRFQQLTKQQDEAQKTTKVIDMRPKTSWLRVAASLVFLIGAGWMAYHFSGFGGIDMVALESGNETLIDTLPDGSVITLNKHSKFSYPETFAGNTRKVTLDGEAFFEISPDKTKPFIITANGIDVKVVGTSFNVRSSEAKTEVVVATGIVEVKKKQEAVILHPHEQATVLKSDAKPVKKMTDELLYNFYRTKEFAFDNTPLWRVIAVLNEAYDVKITLGDPAGSYGYNAISTSFQNEPIEDILRVISETLKIPLEKKDNQYILGKVVLHG